MRRHREQTGGLYKRNGWWILRIRQTVNERGQLATKQKAIQLATTDEYKTKNLVRQSSVYKEKIAGINQGNRTPERVVTLSDFVDTVYLPWCKTNLAASTYKGYSQDIWKLHLKARCDGALLREVKTCDVQQWIDRIAKDDGLSRNPIEHIKNFISGVFSFAIRQDYFDSGKANPVREVQIQKVNKGKETHAYTLDELVALLTKVSEPARTMIAVAGFAGLSKSEIYGLQWPDYAPARMDDKGNLLAATLSVRSSMWRGVRNEDVKNEFRQATVPVIGVLAKLLDAHHVRSGKPAAGPIFRNGNGNALCPDSAYRQFIEDVKGITWHGWHAGRRGLSTVLYDLDVDAKTRQLILRHANVSMTENVYTKRVDRKVTNAMQQLEQSLGAFSLTFPDCAPGKEAPVQ